MTDVVATVANLHFGYRQDEVLRGVELTVRRGQIHFVVGPNGAGKTTLVQLLAGLLTPTSGTVRVFDVDPADTDRRALARRLSYTPQSYRMSFPFTAQEIVLMGRYAHGKAHAFALESDGDLAIADEAMKACEVEALADRRWDELSGGEQRRVLLAQALCQRAELLLLDEPTASLDPAHAIHLMETLAAAVSGGATAVLVSHDLNLAVRFGSQVTVLADGVTRAHGEPTEVLSSQSARDAFGVGLHVGTHADAQTPFVVPF